MLLFVEISCGAWPWVKGFFRVHRFTLKFYIICSYEMWTQRLYFNTISLLIWGWFFHLIRSSISYIHNIIRTYYVTLVLSCNITNAPHEPIIVMVYLILRPDCTENIKFSFFFVLFKRIHFILNERFNKDYNIYPILKENC